MREAKVTIGKYIFAVQVPEYIDSIKTKYKKEDYDPSTAEDCASCRKKHGDEDEDHDWCEMAYLYDMNKHNSSDDDYVDCHKAIKMTEDFVKKCIEYIDTFNPEEVAEMMPKKKNGTFYKNRVHHVVVSPLGRLSEEEYGYRREVLRWKALDDQTVELQFTDWVDGW